jgi:hypothetical protein
MYLVSIEGVHLDDSDHLEFEQTTICKTHPDLLRQVDLDGTLSLESVQKQFPGALADW